MTVLGPFCFLFFTTPVKQPCGIKYPPKNFTDLQETIYLVLCLQLLAKLLCISFLL